ncbi:MAG: hypothetical protein JW806_08690 [Sedimentisphaerales bacterium]|nr:hypothetical protein [Sedimentisphaerales bacterium]
MFKIKICLILTALFTALFLPLQLALGFESAWVQTAGPAGGDIRAIEINPENPDILYAVGYGGSVFKTTNAGATWTMLEPLIEPHLLFYDVVVSHSNPQIIYAFADKLFKSTDSGENWAYINPGRNFSYISIDPANPQIIVGARWDNTVYCSTDGGVTWNNITSNLPGDIRYFADVAVSTENEFWVGTKNYGNGQLYHTTNGGVSWSQVNLEPEEDTDVSTIFVDPRSPNHVFVSFLDDINKTLIDRYLFSTTDGGANWSTLHFPVASSRIRVLGVTPDGQAIYVGGEWSGDICRINIANDTYEQIGQNMLGLNADIAVDPCDANILYAPRVSGLMKTVDDGNNWYFINNGIVNVGMSLMEVPDIPGSGTVYATSLRGEGTFKTTDWGNSWILATNGITDAKGDELTINPHNTQEIWYVDDKGEIFITEDGAQTWEKVNDWWGKGCRFSSVYVLAPTSNPYIIYASKNGFGLFRTNDGGGLWDFLDDSEIDYTYSIAVHPTNPDIAYSGYNPKPFQDWAMVRKTTDRGSSWSTSLHVPESAGITSVAIDPQNPDIVYAGSTGKRGAVYKSIDAGDTWSELNSSFTMCTVWGQSQLISDPCNTSTAYAATWLAGTWKTTDAGENWVLLENAPISATSLSINVLNSNIIYLSDRTTPTVWKTTDAGATWQKIADFSSDGALLVMRVLSSGDTVYAATFHPNLTDGKLYKSNDGGLTWNDTTDTLPKGILDLAVNPDNPDIVYVTTNINWAHKSTDGGATWMQLPNFPDVGAYDIEVDPVEPTTLYASARGGSMPAWFTEIAGDRPDGIVFTDNAGVYKSTDSGSTWTQILTTAASCRAIRLHPDNRNVLFAVDLVDGLMVSIDGGNNWTSHNTGLDSAVPTSVAINGDKVYVGTQGCGVYSGDFDIVGGTITWQPNRSNKPVPQVYSMQIQVDPVNSSRIFVSSNPGGLYRSDNGGVKFTDKNGITPSVVVDDPLRQGYYTYAINPNDVNEIWLGTWGKGIYKSYNAMGLDVPANGAGMKMYGKHIYQIIIDPSPPKTIYAATEEGIFKSSDEGSTWIDFSAGLDTPQVRTIAITANGTLMCGTMGYGIYNYDTGLNQWVQKNPLGRWCMPWPLWANRPLYQYTSQLFHPDDPNIIYFGTFPTGIFKSFDSGSSWLEYNVGWTNDGVFTMVCHPDDAEILFAGTYNGINLSTDGAEHWQMRDQGWPPEQWVFSIAFHPEDPNIMYAASKNGENEGTGRAGFHGTVMKSTNGGQNWFAITNGLNIDQEFYKIIPDKYDHDVLYLATQLEGVFISRNGGDSWLPWNEGLIHKVAGTNGNNVTDTMVMSADGLNLYFGTLGAGIYRRSLFAGCTEDANELITLVIEWQETGNLTKDINGDGQIDIIDYGMLENFSRDYSPYDLNIDGVINFCDFALFAQHWLETDFSTSDFGKLADLSRDFMVDISDLEILLGRWLTSNDLNL